MASGGASQRQGDEVTLIVVNKSPRRVKGCGALKLERGGEE